MTLVDTSVWIEFLRGTTTRAAAFVDEHLGDDLAVTEPVLMEVLAGARSGSVTMGTERLLLSQRWLALEPLTDYRAAVDIFQATRASGHPPRALNDCLIAAVAMRVGVAVAHRDADFAYIAAATGLDVIDLRS